MKPLNSAASHRPKFATMLPVKLRGACFRQAIRFSVVGFVNTVLDLFVLNVLILITGVGHSGPLYTLFKAVSFFVALTNSYVMNAKWTFGEPGGRATILQGGQFAFVSTLGLALNVGSASYVVAYVPPPLQLHSYWPSIAALVGTFCSFISNFLGYKYFVFSASRWESAASPSPKVIPNNLAQK